MTSPTLFSCPETSAKAENHHLKSKGSWFAQFTFSNYLVLIFNLDCRCFVNKPHFRRESSHKVSPILVPRAGASYAMYSEKSSQALSYHHQNKASCLCQFFTAFCLTSLCYYSCGWSSYLSNEVPYCQCIKAINEGLN